MLLLACADERAPTPSFRPVFPPLTGELMTMSSPNLADLNRDGIADIVFGTGKDRLTPQGDRYVFSGVPAIAGYVVAVSGATNEILWKVANPGEAFTTARFLDVTRDGVPDIIMGGREGAFSAYSGYNGELVWRLSPAAVATTSVPYNFFTPATIRDANGDGVADLLVVYGGDDTRLPGQPRSVGYLAVISAADGTVLAVDSMPDGRESYSSVVVYERADGTQWFIFGTGGETQGGAAYRAPVAALFDGTFGTLVERLIEPGAAKGVIAPATVVELTGDAEPDVVISTFDGRLLVMDGATRALLWEKQSPGEETYHPPAVVRISRSGRLGLFVSRGIGTFPRYTGSVHRLYDAVDGRLFYHYRDNLYPAGAPLAVDLTGDGIDEPFFFSVRYPVGHGARIHIVHGRSGELIVHDVETNLAATPHIADPRGSGTLELIGVSWSIEPGTDVPDWQDLRSHLLRLDLSAPPPPFRGWAAYLGTTTDGLYHPPPGKPRN